MEFPDFMVGGKRKLLTEEAVEKDPHATCSFVTDQIVTGIIGFQPR